MDHEVKFWAIEVLRVFEEEIKKQAVHSQATWHAALILPYISRAIEATIERLEGENNRN
jgi:hypothetical protein